MGRARLFSRGFMISERRSSHFSAFPERQFCNSPLKFEPSRISFDVLLSSRLNDARLHCEPSQHARADQQYPYDINMNKHHEPGLKGKKLLALLVSEIKRG